VCHSCKEEPHERHAAATRPGVVVRSSGGHWVTLDYSWMHYRGYLALLLIVVGSAASGWIVARLHRDHQTAMMLAFLVALVLAAAAQLVIQVRLVGGFWTDYGTRTTGARQNATF
jgi:uncharacterized membrane protein YfcA